MRSRSRSASDALSLAAPDLRIPSNVGADVRYLLECSKGAVDEVSGAVQRWLGLRDALAELTFAVGAVHASRCRPPRQPDDEADEARPAAQREPRQLKVAAIRALMAVAERETNRSRAMVEGTFRVFERYNRQLRRGAAPRTGPRRERRRSVRPKLHDT